MPTKCPECSHPVAPEATQCPNCPASWESEEDGYRPIRRSGALSNIPLPVIWLGILALGGLVFWKAVNGFVDSVDGSDSVVSRIVNSHLGELDPKVARAVKGGPADGRYGADAHFNAKSPGATLEDEEAIVKKEPGQWHFRGRVIDLVTLQAVPGAEIIFSDERKGMRLVVKSDETGSYFASLPPLGKRGYMARVAADGYADGYLNPGTDNVPEMTQPDRASLAADVAAAGDVYTVQGYGSDVVDTDFYLAPLSAPKPAP